MRMKAKPLLLECRHQECPELGIVDAVIEEVRWEAAGLEALAQVAAKSTLEYLELEPEAYEFCLLGCDDQRISELNERFRGHTRPTNVLSWPSDSREPVIRGGDPQFPYRGDLGNVAIAYETCLQESVQQGKAFSSHVSHLLVHGLLHLLGYDHVDDRDSERMEALETEILATLGIQCPY